MTRTVMLSLAVVFITASALAESPTKNSAIIGHWKGTMDGLPAITLVVEEDDDKLMGAVLFYLIRRDPGAAPSASPGFPGPMIKPGFDGKTLTFKVSHRYAHPPRTLNDPPVSFRLGSRPGWAEAAGAGPQERCLRGDPLRYQGRPYLDRGRHAHRGWSRAGAVHPPRRGAPLR